MSTNPATPPESNPAKTTDVNHRLGENQPRKSRARTLVYVALCIVVCAIAVAVTFLNLLGQAMKGAITG